MMLTLYVDTPIQLYGIVVGNVICKLLLVESEVQCTSPTESYRTGLVENFCSQAHTIYVRTYVCAYITELNKI